MFVVHDMKAQAAKTRPEQTNHHVEKPQFTPNPQEQRRRLERASLLVELD